MERLLLGLYAGVNRLDRWFKQRFSPTGVMLAGLLVLAGVFGVNTRANLAYQLFALALAMLGVAMACAPWFRARIRVRRRLPRYATDGEVLRYRVLVTNETKRVQRGLFLMEEVSVARLGADDVRAYRHAGPEGRRWWRRVPGYAAWLMATRWREGAQTRPVALPDLPPGRTTEVEMSWTPQRRGMVRLRGYALLRPDPLGLFYAVRRFALAQSVLVMPRRYPVNAMAWRGRLRERPGGAGQSVSSAGHDEFAALREYRPGDPLRHIDWKGWARLGVPIVKEFFDTSLARHAVVLDTGLPQRASRARFEAAVSVAASFVAPVPASAGGAPELVFIGAEAHALGAGGLGAADGVLESLACVMPQPGFQLDALSDALSARAGELSACVCVLLEWDAPRRELIEALCRMDVHVLVLVVLDDPAGTALHPGPMARWPERFRVLPAASPGPALATLGIARAGEGAAAA